MYECDFNKLPFEDIIKIVFGKRLSYSSYAKTCYEKHKYIFISYCGTVYGTGRTKEKAIKLSEALKNIDLGRL